MVMGSDRRRPRGPHTLLVWGDSPHPPALWAWVSGPSSQRHGRCSPSGGWRPRPRAGCVAGSCPLGVGGLAPTGPHPPPSHPLSSPARGGVLLSVESTSGLQGVHVPASERGCWPVWPEPPGTCLTLGPSQHLAEFERTELSLDRHWHQRDCGPEAATRDGPGEAVRPAGQRVATGWAVS